MEANTETPELSKKIIEVVDNLDSSISKESNIDKDEKPIKRFSWLLFFGIFLLCLPVFLYILFPYDVMKDVLITQIEKNTKFNVSIAEMGPAFPLGVIASNVELQPENGLGSIKLKELKIKISVLSLFIGNLSPNIFIKDDGKGDLALDLSMSYLGALFGGSLSEKNISDVHLDANKFDIERIADFGLNTFGSSNALSSSMKALLSSELEKISLAGKLDGVVDVDLDIENPKNTNGKVDLELVDFELNINDENMKSLEQDFSKALIKAQIKSGKLQFDKNAGLLSKGLDIKFSGNMQFAKKAANSNANMMINLKMMNKLQEEFGFMLNAAGGSESDSKKTWKLSGPISNLNVVTQ